MALHDSGRSPRKRPSRPRLSPTPSAEALLGRSLTRKASRRLSDIIHSIFGNDADSRMSEEGGGEDGGGEGGGKGGSKDGDGNGDSNGDKDGVNVSRDQRWGDALGVSERGWQGEGGVGDAGGDAGGGGGEGTNEGADASPLSKHDSGVRSDFWVSIRGDNRRSGTGGRFSVDVAVLTRRGVGSEREREWERAASALPHPWHALRDAAVAAGNKAGHSHATVRVGEHGGVWGGGGGGGGNMMGWGEELRWGCKDLQGASVARFITQRHPHCHPRCHPHSHPHGHPHCKPQSHPFIPTPTLTPNPTPTPPPVLPRAPPPSLSHPTSSHPTQPHPISPSPPVLPRGPPLFDR